MDLREETKQLDTHSIRLSDRDVKWLERNGNNISKQLRIDLGTYRIIEKSLQENPGQPIGEIFESIKKVVDELA